MSSTYDNTVFDFDLDFLNQPPANNAVTAEPDLQARCDRLRKSVIFFKKRVKVIDHYVTVAKAAKNEIAELRITETQLKNQCKQHHVEIGNFIDKVTRLENEIQAAEVRERQKNEIIAELENKNVATQKIYAQYKVLAEEHKLELNRKKGKAIVINNAKKTLIEKEVETLRKNNAKFLNLDKVNEKLRKENARIPILEKEIEDLRKNNAFVSDEVTDLNEIARIEQLEKEVATLCKENAKITKLENEIEVLCKENAEIPKLEREIINLQKENKKILKLEKEIEYLQKENVKIPKLIEEIENLQKQNARLTKLGDKKETFSKLNIKISNLEKANDILHIKNTEIETENKVLRKKNVTIPNRAEDIETQLTSTTRDNGKSRTKHNKLMRKYKSLPDRAGGRSDDSEAENDVFEDPLLSPIPNDTIDKKSLIAGKDIAVPREFDTEHSSEHLVTYSLSNGKNIENEGKSKDTSMPESCPILLKENENPTITIFDHNENLNLCELESAPHKKSHRTNNELTVSNSVDAADNLMPKKSTQEKECLEINNSLRCESHAELELENIFRTMKLNYNAISPIPRTPTNVDTCTPSEKFEKCSSLCYKTIDFMQTLIRIAVSQGRDRDKVNINDCDKMIACFESILKSEQILTETNHERSLLNTNFNMEISNCLLGRNDNNLGTISNSESLTSSQTKTDTSQSKKCNKTLSQSSSLLQEENQIQLLCNDTKSIAISNISSPDKVTNINRDKQVEKASVQCLPMSMDENQLIDHSVSEELATDNILSKDTDSDRSSRDIIEVNQPPIIQKKRKNKKKSKLEKLKKKLEPKYKIRREKTLPENLKVKPKHRLPIKRKVTENDTSASLNHKDIYEKAVKFMAQLNSKQSSQQAKTPPKHTQDIHKPQRHTACLEKYFDSNGDNQLQHNCSVSTRSKRKISELFDSCAVVLMKDSLLVSPRKSENSAIHREKEDSSINNSITHIVEENIKSSDELPLRKRLRRTFDKPINTLSNNAKEDNDSTTGRVTADKNSTLHKEKEDIICTSLKVNENTEQSNEVPLRKRLRSSSDKTLNIFSSNAVEENNSTTYSATENKNFTSERAKDNGLSNELPLRKRLRRSSNEPLVQYKRVLRSAIVHTKVCTEDNNELSKSKGKSSRKLIKDPRKNENATQINDGSSLHNNNVVSYEDLALFSEDIQLEKKMSETSKYSSDKPFDILSINAKEDNNSTTHITKEDIISTPHRTKEDSISTTHTVTENIKPSDEQLPLQNGRRHSCIELFLQHKRVLRSASVHTKLCTEDENVLSKSKGEVSGKLIMGPSENESATQINYESSLHNSNVVSYKDLDDFSENIQLANKMYDPVLEEDTDEPDRDPKDSILCYMIKKYGVGTARRIEKKIPGKVVTNICEKIEREITIIKQNEGNQKAKDNLVADLRKLNYKHFIGGLMQFLAKPERKLELFGKVRAYPAPAMTKTEQILLYVIGQLKNYWPSVDIVDAVLSSIEFTLFKLNRTPEFDVIESTSHFYAVLCRFVKAQSRLRLFILDAMYCIQFKSVPVIKQCLEVWMSLIPLSHMGIAKTPMVTCLVYLLHFYKCDDKYNRVQEIRNILREQYFYNITDWSETKILEMFKNSITDLKDNSMEKKMLRLALIILAKRRGPQWCQLHIIQNLLQPMIEKKNIPKNVKQFCVSVIGPLMKPYPVNMKVYCEIAITQLLDILDNNPTPEMEEAALTSMMIINRHDQHSLNKMLLSRKMKPMSIILEKTIRDYIKTRPLKAWGMHLATIALELESYNHYDKVV